MPKPKKPESEKSEPNRIEFKKDKLDEWLREKPDKQQTKWDTKQTGLCVLISLGPAHKPEATVTFRVCYYLPREPGKPRYQALHAYTGKAKEITDARSAANRIRDDAKKKGIDPKRPDLEGEPFEKVVESFIEEHAKNNRTWRETQAIFDRYVLPEWRDWKIGSIKRSDVAALLRKIKAKGIRQEKKKGPDGKLVKTGRKIGSSKSADATLAQLSKLFNWYAIEYAPDEWHPPIVKGMRRTKPVKRERVLSDAEIGALWAATGKLGIFGAGVRAMLLTAQRVKKVEQMRRADLKGPVLIPGRKGENGEWIEDAWLEDVWDPTRDDDPENKQVSVVPLSEKARKAIDSVPIIDAGRKAEDFVFSLDGIKPINGRSKWKARLDKLMLAALRERTEAEGGNPDAVELEHWQLRDLRRTARTLMSRLGVRTEIAELCLAHVKQGVEGTYDRFAYVHEKRQAFDVLASLIDRITNPPEGDSDVDNPPEGDNVFALPTADRAKATA